MHPLTVQLDQTLSRVRPEKEVRAFCDSGAMAEILPEIMALKGVEQPKKFHPEGDVFEHTMLMLSHIAWPDRLLGWAVLMHDIGKPASQTFAEDGTPHFYGHESIGADMAQVILKRLELPDEETGIIVNAVRNHMRFAHIDKMKPQKWKRIALEPHFSLELELHRIDCISSNGLMGNYVLMLDRLRKLHLSGEDRPPVKPLLSGFDLIRLGLQPGSVFAKLLKESLDLQKKGILKTHADAVQWAKKNEVR